jgi:uncharacterized protein (TIGR00255 family)
MTPHPGEGRTMQGMTGFARVRGAFDRGVFAWEARSVNSKSIDVRLAAPTGWDAIEFEVRRRARERVNRGALQLTLKIEEERPAQAAIVDVRELHRLERRARRWARGGGAPSSLAGLMAAPGVSRMAARGAGPDDDAVAAVLAGLEAALAALVQTRQDEGAQLRGVLTSMLQQFDSLLASARIHADRQPELVRERLLARLDELARERPLAPDRLAAEAALAASRADVREELDRLGAHVATARALIAAAEPIGRRLDFLCQEFGREANTLCAKSASLELTTDGLALKSLIEQFREQVQNVE